ncbi:hypothetical protein ACFFQW_33280 [Umezawaea endophytica]|uniref:Uncharacterized protein n=1 Tax=Umezawaea endophytica TaxID=1654476 RepID=A0A9X3A5Z2_9PSEU|nr:hypothetical protein [Umezawaea endophytica]MCS7484244.1 hypothetical protein [Umezawaea endophytica]
MPGPREFGPDGTQAPPPPPVYPDALAGLVTGETRYRPKAVVPPAPAFVPVVPDPELARQAIRTAMLHEQRARPVRARQPLPPQMQVSAHRVQYQAPVAPTPLAHPQATSPQRMPQTERPKSRGSAFGGCLVALLIIGSVFFNVIRQVVEALLDAIR